MSMCALIDFFRGFGRGVSGAGGYCATPVVPEPAQIKVGPLRVFSDDPFVECATDWAQVGKDIETTLRQHQKRTGQVI